MTNKDRIFTSKHENYYNLLEFFEANEPPTPPPIAAAAITTKMIIEIHKHLRLNLDLACVGYFRQPHSANDQCCVTRERSGWQPYVFHITNNLRNSFAIALDRLGAPTNAVEM